MNLGKETRDRACKTVFPSWSSKGSFKYVWRQSSTFCWLWWCLFLTHWMNTFGGAPEKSRKENLSLGPSSGAKDVRAMELSCLYVSLEKNLWEQQRQEIIKDLTWKNGVFPTPGLLASSGHYGVKGRKNSATLELWVGATQSRRLYKVLKRQVNSTEWYAKGI